jgi:hypothetical protein
MVVVGLAAWLLLTPACLAVAMMVGVNNGNPMTIVFVNFPGPKVWAVPIIRFAVGPADGSLIYFLSVLSPLLIAGAVYLVTWPRQAHQRERLFSLRRVARVSTAVLSGGIFGVLLAMVPVNTVAQQLSMAMLAIASVELPCTIVLYLYLSNVARTMELPDEAMFLRICAIAIGAASLAALFIGLGPQRPRMLAREAPFQVLFWCYGAVTVTTAIVAYASLVRVAAAIWGIAWARPNRKIPRAVIYRTGHDSAASAGQSAN